MGGWTKLFSSLPTSSIWSEDLATRVVWVTMLAVADADGLVEGSVPGFARLANITIDEMQTAIARLASPDPYSRTPDHEGRRIEVIEGGWRILNYKLYRERSQSKDGSKAPAMRAYRARLKAGGYPTSEQVTDGNALPPTATSDPEERGKRKEERVQDPSDPVSSATLRAAEPAVLEFPTIGKGPSSWALTQAQIDEWRALYPGLDVLAECRQALAWVRANRSRTARGMPAFLVRWLNRAVDQPRGSGGAGTTGRSLSRTTATTMAAASIMRQGGGSCPHAPRCVSVTACRDRTIADGRAARTAASGPPVEGAA